MADRTTDILDHIVSALAAFNDPDAGGKLFAAVRIYDSPESFLDNPGMPTLNVRSAGVVAGDLIRGKGMGSGDAYAERMPVEIFYAFPVKRKPGQDERTATAEALRLSGLIRTALLEDPSRGGRCGLTNFDGRYVNGTDADGTARLVDRIPDQAVYTAALPIIVGWMVPEPE
jgi:hypothetical protein